MRQSSEIAVEKIQIGDPIKLTVEKFDPSRDSEPQFETFSVPYTKEMRVLEALDYVVEELGESLSYQWFCGVKKCGMCGVMVNGRQTLGCWEPVQAEMTVRPLSGFPVIRDLVIDRSRYFEDVQSLSPWFDRQQVYSGFPEAITGVQLEAAAETMHCIECMLCVSACPANGDSFMGPAPMVQLAKFALDPRDGGDRASAAREIGGLDHCVGCLQCTRVCPAEISIFDTAIEGLKQQTKAAGRPSRRSRFFANIHDVARRGSRFASVANWAAGSRLARRIVERILKIDRRRALPRFAKVPFDRWFRKRDAGQSTGTSVVLFHDTFVTYFEPEIGQAATHLLEAAGYNVSLADGRKCCGRPMLSERNEEKARAVAAHNVQLLAPIARQGTPIVGLEPSCVLTIRKDYPNLLASDDARLLADHVLTFEEFIAEEAQAGRFTLSPSKPPDEILLHGHCHQKVMIGTGPAMEALALTGAQRVEEIPTTCCGMAGSNGYECEHYERSLEAAEVTLLPAVRAASSSTEIVAAGVSCRQQIKSGTDRIARHPAEILYASLVQNNSTGGPS